jgi:hypothetical protein
MSKRASFGLGSLVVLVAAALLFAAPTPARAGVHFQWVFAKATPAAPGCRPCPGASSLP